MSAEALTGRTVVLTRARDDNRGLAERLLAHGATIVEVPAVRYAIADDLRDWRRALDGRRAVTHLAFTSPRAVSYFAELSELAGLAADAWAHCRVGAVGERTARSLRERSLVPHVIADPPRADELGRALVRSEGVGPGSLVVVPCSSIARPELAEELEISGASVLAPAIYETLPGDPADALELRRQLASHSLDAIVFASPSAISGVIAMLEALRPLSSDDHAALLAARVIAIGPTTRESAEERGWTRVLVAQRPDEAALEACVLGACLNTE